MYGSRGGRWPETKVVQGPTRRDRGFLACFDPFQAGIEVILVTFSGFQPRQNPTETLKLGQNKAGNGFSTLGGIPCCQPLGPTLMTREASVWGLTEVARMRSHGTDAQVHAHLPGDPTSRLLGQQKWVEGLKTSPPPPPLF